MPQSLSVKNVNTFVKGLNTEAGELTFPDDFSVDELNCDLRRNGERRRREGIKLELEPTPSSFSFNNQALFGFGTWHNVAGNSDTEYLVIQINSKLYFYDKKASPLSSHEVSGQSIDLTSFEQTGSTGSANSRCEYTSLNGLLIVANPGAKTIFIREDQDTGVISATAINFRVRDFKWISPRGQLTNAIDEEAVTAERIYDTQNAGWVGPKGSAALETFLAANTTSEFIFVGEGDNQTQEEVITTGTRNYPPLTLPWFSGKTAAGAFSVTEWEKVQAGTTLIGNGHYILDFFKKDRSQASGVLGITPETEANRFSTVSSLGGRVFYSGLESDQNSGVILFSPVVEGFSGLNNTDTTAFGECHQVNDPSSEDLTDLLDTDGGVIRILEAEGIKKLHAFNNSIFVFARNGVWQIKGIDDVFKATGFAVNKVSSIGISDKESFVSVEGVPYWWSDFGIHRLGFDNASFQSSEENLTIGTIQEFFDNIEGEARVKAKGSYDEVNKKIYWVYPNNGETTNHKNNNVLILDLVLTAFYPWKIEDLDTNSPHLLGLTYYTGFSARETPTDILDESDVIVTDEFDVPIFFDTKEGFETGDSIMVALCYNSITETMTMGAFNSTDFLDWGGANYSSYAVGGYDFMGDLMGRKNSPYIDVVLKRTETGFSLNGDGSYSLVRPSSLKVTALWDFKTTGTSTQQAYRFKRVPIVNENDLTEFDPGDTVLNTRLKIRGRGRSVALKFESETGKDFILLGYGKLNARNNRP